MTLVAAERLATQIETDLTSAELSELASRMQTLDQSCKQCHMKYRN